MSTFFKKSYWPTFLIVDQTIILFHLKDGLDRQYLTTDSIHLVIGFFIFANIFVAIFSNSKMWDKSWDKKSDSSKKKYILKKSSGIQGVGYLNEDYFQLTQALKNVIIRELRIDFLSILDQRNGGAASHLRQKIMLLNLTIA